VGSLQRRIGAVGLGGTAVTPLAAPPMSLVASSDSSATVNSAKHLQVARPFRVRHAREATVVAADDHDPEDTRNEPDRRRDQRSSPSRQEAQIR
jgi:hypothetical protein